VTLLVNSGEGGSNSTTVTTGNSGGASGDAFTTVYTGGGAAAAIYATGSAISGVGTLGFYSTVTGDAPFSWLRWVVTGSAIMTLRGYFRLGSLAPVSTCPVIFSGAGDAVAGGAGVNTAGYFSVRGSPQTEVWQSSAKLVASTIYRFELAIQAGTTISNGTIRAAYYLGNSITPVEMYEALSTANTGTANLTYCNFGVYGGTLALDYDDLAFTNVSTGFIGPVSVPDDSKRIRGQVPVLAVARAATW
jgi:hypothetical protein